MSKKKILVKINEKKLLSGHVRIFVLHLYVVVCTFSLSDVSVVVGC
jgi:hypothetical protein